MKANCYGPSCDNAVHCNGLCSTHDGQRRNGRPLTVVIRKGSLVRRLWLRVKKTPGCWWWTGKTRRGGYGLISIVGSPQKVTGAHRASWMLHNGPIPTGLLVLHRCDNRLCVRPSHLFLGTNRDNMGDMAQKGRASRGEKHARATITAPNVRALRIDHARHEVPRKELAARYGISESALKAIVSRNTWRHVK